MNNHVMNENQKSSSFLSAQKPSTFKENIETLQNINTPKANLLLKIFQYIQELQDCELNLQLTPIYANLVAAYLRTARDGK